jgi:Uma2 family endonuclease
MTTTSADDPTPPPFTVDDLMHLPDDGARYELFDGSLLVSPAPSSLHQLVAQRLLVALVSVVPPEYEPLDTSNVKVDDENYFIPDLVVVRAESVYADTLMFTPADVLLAIEIVSHSTRKRDRILKLGAYAEARIPHYWRVEPTEGPALYSYELDGDDYRLVKAASGGERTELTSPFPMTIDPAGWIGRRRTRG